MSQAPYRQPYNHRLSFQRIFGNSLSVTAPRPTDGTSQTFTIPIYAGSPYADPDAMRDPDATPDRGYVSLTWLDEMAGRKGMSTVQVDVRTRKGPHGDPLSDPFGLVAARAADALEDYFHGLRENGEQKGWIDVYDFTGDPTDPSDTGACLLISNPGAPESWGQPSSRLNLQDEDGFNRIVLRYSMRLVEDGVPVAYGSNA